MKHLKFLLLAIMALCLNASVNAQKTKAKTKTKTTQQMDSIKYQCPMKCEEDKTYSKPGKCPVCNMKLKEVKATTAVYQCPMGCEGEKTYAKEGKCPVCNMKLKKVEAKKATKGHQGHKHS